MAERCRILLSYSSINHVPAVGNHPTAKIVLVFIKADELPVLTIAFFYQSRAGKYRYFSDMILGAESAESRAYSSDKSAIVAPAAQQIFLRIIHQQNSLNAAGSYYRILPQITCRQ
ncbi:hypothetical protein DC081_10155 [Ignatzschineria cameli]|uniref:Uncharacterized protein n=2 Tax=Ignatzschineria cameli TaxID=2182793 RepID=A0A2U2AKF8_9GAMM|nr:hypothetical protein [Ignatzschineria cameli]PWD83350.1 hypothetical protein DC077_10055 [Ignatzschineria cameli]PWD85705.1 hypothetical protein DC080_05700 [Ignatzschineria cameli]PWD88375.1 hypothetical protein DC079_09900 [Ignatzschineria cameli]PWD88835.1 hypothetical protein DC081_10155 [Ignatzschineria cameli]PWD89341.1 hypothetical protein DC078_09930 [Ignatzschineria cameli]